MLHLGAQAEHPLLLWLLSLQPLLLLLRTSRRMNLGNPFFLGHQPLIDQLGFPSNWWSLDHLQILLSSQASKDRVSGVSSVNCVL